MDFNLEIMRNCHIDERSIYFNQVHLAGLFSLTGCPYFTLNVYAIYYANATTPFLNEMINDGI